MAFIQRLELDHEFLKECNSGSKFMDEEAIKKLQQIANYYWLDSQGNKQFLLKENELQNLSIRKGTLTDEERKVINHHIVMTQKMLQALPFPNHLKNVPEIAGNHHERMDGRGYPNGLKGDELSIQARMMCIADIFEALTAADRPYKKAMNLSTSLRILGEMALDNHIDADLFEVFVSEKVYLKYAEKFLNTEQIDAIELADIPGYRSATETRRAG